MSTISYLKSHLEFYQAGDDEHISRKFWGIEINLKKRRTFVFDQCRAFGLTRCGNCEHYDCFFSEFSRIYWNYPPGD